MTTRARIAILALLAVQWSAAQKVVKSSEPDPVQAAIGEFKRHASSKPNEVTVVLPPEGKTPATVQDPLQPEHPPTTSSTPGTGQEEPQAEGGHDTETTLPALPQPPDPQQQVVTDPAAKPPQGLAVRVEKVQEGKGNIDPSKVKLTAPFPAKLLSQAPTGWHLEASESAPPFTREIELSPGKKITLKIRPHILVPDADGSGVFTVAEPGFDPALGYRQKSTVGALLANSLAQLDNDSKELGNVIDNLQQLLVSLPKTETPPEPKPEAKPEPKPEIKTTPPRKR